MTPRIDVGAVAPEALNGLHASTGYLQRQSGLEPALLDLVSLRASQMNGCAFCMAMHVLEAKERGERDERLHGLIAWREAGWYTERERAALAWTEAVTDITHGHVDDDVYAAARAVFSEHELVALNLAVVTINSWNRFSIPFRMPPEAAPAVIAALGGRERTPA
ncbi:MAG TPA: carboxymuconolactone decarboxylase family protein [Candidatus Acidoferrum sp.]|nr:carboxymuconolactone decarboxylase family protein [Candidatus Acidoferrum sp.]